MKNVLKNISLLLLAALVLLPFPEGISAQAQSAESTLSTDDITFDEVTAYGEIVKEYIVNNDEHLIFDYVRAVNENVPEQVINQGLLLEHISYQYAQSKSNTDGTEIQTKAISLPIWGNYCGPGYGGKDSTKPALDVLDEGCKRHDRGTMATVAWAIKTYFSTIGQVGC